MSPSSKIRALLSRDHAALGDAALEEGNLSAAARHFARAGDYRRAGSLFAEAGEPEPALEALLWAAFGEMPEGYEDATPQQVGELLASRDEPELSLTAFELGRCYKEAARVALKIRRPDQAARYYELAGLWRSAARHYRKANRLPEALRALTQESNRLRRAMDAAPSKETAAENRKVHLERAELLAALGRPEEASRVLDGLGPTPLRARLLEKEGRLGKALEVFLQLNQTEDVLRLLPQVDHLAPGRRAQILRRCGRPGEAAELLAAHGQAGEAAALFEAGHHWQRAATLWERAKDFSRAALAYLRADQPKEAARCFTAAGKTELAAEAYERAGDFAAAASAYASVDRTRRAASCYLQAQRRLEAAQLLLDGGDKAQAIAILHPITPSSSDYEAACLILLPLLVESGQLAEAQKRLDNLPASEGLSAGAEDRLYWQGRLAEEHQAWDDALLAYRKVLERSPDYGDAELRLNRVAERLGQPVPRLSGTRLVWADPDRPDDLTESGAARALTDFDSPVGTVLANRYEILGEVGEGGMGRIYRALDQELGETIALKTLSGLRNTDSAAIARLLREVQLCRRLSHPNIVRIYDLGRYPLGLFITMELLEGPGLDEFVGPDDRLPLSSVRRVLMEVAEGLKAAHAQGIVHRDLKPANIILTSAGAKILDFGIARSTTENTTLTQPGQTLGSPRYMSPEQLQGLELDGRSDLYSLGVIAFALITGKEPFDGPNYAAIALEHLQGRAPLLETLQPDLPAEWSGFVGGLMARQAERRYASAAAVLEALSALPVGRP